MEPTGPAALTGPARAWQRHPVLAEVVKAVVLAAGILTVGIGTIWAVATWTAAGYPSCSWPLRARGHPSAHQVGLVRCYLQALSRNDPAAMMAVTDNDPPVQLTPADFAHTADARAGLATATFIPNPSDTFGATVTITFADHARTSVYLINLIAVGGPSVWRLQIGTALPPGSGGPPPAQIPPHGTVTGSAGRQPEAAPA